jgi:predicted phosphoribosyltransferase
VGEDLTAEINARFCARKRTSHRLRDADQSRGNRLCYRDFHQMSDDEATNILGRALSPIEHDPARWMT